jgi:uncharacterized membrane protein YphA (DoxX/SURF4 family)
MKIKIVLGIITLLPAVYCIFFMGVILFGLISTWNPSYEFTRALILLHFVCILLVICLLTFYIHNAYGNPNITAEQKTIWMAILFFGNVISMPVYWYHYVFRSPVSCSKMMSPTKSNPNNDLGEKVVRNH